MIEKLLKNKLAVYITLGAVVLFEFIVAILNWSKGGFSVTGLVLLIISIGLFVSLGIGLAKGNKLLTLICTMGLFTKITIDTFTVSGGLISACSETSMPALEVTYAVFLFLAALGFLGAFVLLFVKVYGVKIDLVKIIPIVGLVVTTLFFVAFIISLCGGSISTQVVFGGLENVGIGFLLALLPHHIELKAE